MGLPGRLLTRHLSKACGPQFAEAAQAAEALCWHASDAAAAGNLLRALGCWCLPAQILQHVRVGAAWLHGLAGNQGCPS